MTDSIENKIKNWLKTQGYPLEMRVASTFQERGFSITQADYYKDPQEDKYREIDIVASMSTIANEDRHISFDIQLIIECKYSHDAPWLLFQGFPDEFSESIAISLRQANSPGRFALLEMSLQEDMKSNYLFKLPPRLSYGITRAITKQTDIPYNAVLSACKATSALVNRSELWNKNRILAVQLLFPAVVVDGRLFECYLDKNNNVALSETNKGTLLFRNPAVGSDLSFVDIITLDGLPHYAEQIEAGCKQIIDRVRHALPRFKNHLSS